MISFPHGESETSVRPFFSGHTSIGEYPILTWGSDDLKQRYLPAAARGDKVLAFGLTEPEAGSNPLEMQSEFCMIAIKKNVRCPS